VGKGIIIGGGTMGADIAAIFVAHGDDVEIVEIDAATRAGLPARVAASADEIGTGLSPGRVRVLETIGEVDWRGAEIVIECVFEQLPVKQAVFAELDRAAPAGVPVTSNSSGFPISRIAEGLETARRMAGLHFFMPGHLVPCVEVIRGERTEPATIEAVFATMARLGKKPVRVKKDVPGFLANRIQHALMREAISLVDQGFASAEDVDTAVRYGFGFRYVAAGPLLQKDLAGIDIHCAAAATMYPYLNNDREPAKLMRDLVAAGKRGVKAKQGFYAWDDDGIAAADARYKKALRRALEILRDEEEDANRGRSEPRARTTTVPSAD
jgi:3-hydroxybutyryl-CoA dehydrogenase